MMRAIDASPDGKYVRVTRMVKPFSYDVPVSSFGSIEEIWDVDGKMLAKVNDRPINLGVQDDTAPPPDPPARAPAAAAAARISRASARLAWRADGQGLTYLEQEPPPPGEDNAGGARGRGARPRRRRPATISRRGRRGAACSRSARIASTSGCRRSTTRARRSIYESNTRMTGHRFSPDMQMLFVSERAGQNTVEYAVYLNEPAKRYTLARYRADDIYANPGSIVSARGGGGGGGRGGGGGGGGAAAVAAAVRCCCRPTARASSSRARSTIGIPNEVGPKTFIDRVAIKTGEKKRIYESDNNGVFERVSHRLDPEASRSSSRARARPRCRRTTCVDGTAARKQLTQNQDYTPDLTKARSERFIVERAGRVQVPRRP